MSFLFCKDSFIAYYKLHLILLLINKKAIA
nr:MAG TPA: hypothetical protein [Caudoviricetes sp.]